MRDQLRIYDAGRRFMLLASAMVACLATPALASETRGVPMPLVPPPLPEVGTGAPAERIPMMPPEYYGMKAPVRDTAVLRQVMLDESNAERATHGLAPLVWDEALAMDAARYAQEMAATGLFRHSPKSARSSQQGENLWMGPHGLYDYAVMVRAFLEEKKLFRAEAKLPHFSTTGSWRDVGHYTQIIWRDTTHMGCALAEAPDNDFLVCRYTPPGNAFGRNPLDYPEARPTTIASAGDRPQTETASLSVSAPAAQTGQ